MRDTDLTLDADALSAFMAFLAMALLLVPENVPA